MSPAVHSVKPVAQSASDVDSVSETQPPANEAAALYQYKGRRYFLGKRQGFVNELPTDRTGRLLEIGCGAGNTAAYAKSQAKCGWCCGVELCPEPASEAARNLDQVIVGDIEEVPLDFPSGHFDTLIMSEVLEHLRDPWATLRRLHPLLKPGALVLAGSPNVAHHTVLRMLLRGRWDYATVGIMDQTHLRWFTPDTYVQLFENSGYRVESVGPATPLGIKASWFNKLTLRRFEYLLHTQIQLKARRL